MLVASQIATHQPYGGVVPELASREHLRAIVPVVRQALEQAHHTYDSIDAIAVTQGPGLAGALLVGISYAKALAYALDKPLIAVNHLEGHIHAVLLDLYQNKERQKGSPELQFPVLAWSSLADIRISISLHETGLRGPTRISAILATTRPEKAFDKVAKLLVWDIREAR